MTSTVHNKHNTHNIGIDLLRQVSMFMIVILHVLGVGGILSNLEVPNSMQYRISWLLEISAYCAVNCYAFISGYVGLYSRFRISRLLQLWLQIIFYTIIITAIFYFKQPETITSQDWVYAFFPIIHDQYWYLTSYFGMSLFVPMMNLALHTFNKKQLSAMVLAIFIFIITIPTFIHLDPFMLTRGYSTIWLCLLYFIGGYLKKYDILSPLCPFLGLFTYIFMIALTLFLKCNNFSHFVEYTSPTIFLAGLGLLIFFSNLKIKSTFIKKLIALLSPTTLGVYIIHTNPLIYWRLLLNSTIPFLQYRTHILVLMVLGTAFFIYLICSIIDLTRIFIFKKLCINEKTTQLDSLLEKYLNQ